MTKELIKKLEALEGPEAGSFHEVFQVIYPEPKWLFSTDKNKKLLDRQNWLLTKTLFSERLACQAWESAAIMLVPEGCEYTMDQRHQEAILARSNCYGREEWHEKAEHKHPAIALLICILKAKELVK